MSLDELEQLIRKYLSTGVAVVVVLVAPGTGGTEALPAEPSVTVIEPGDEVAGGTPGGNGTGENGSGENGGSAGDDEEPGAEGGEEDAAGSGGSRSGPADGSNGAGDAAGSSTGEGTTAAERLGWGAPDREDQFTDGTDGWSIYDGPGHGGNGRRSPEAVSVADGVLTITGDESGTTAGMAWMPGQKYGRWEGRVRAPIGDSSYNALMLLWPDAENFPVGGEVDFMEMLDPERRTTDLFIHYGADNSQVNGQVEVDGTQWHNWAVEWTPESITAYVDGEEWYRTTDTSILPPGPMHLCLQLDWFPDGNGDVQETRMEVDWVRQYSLDGSGGSPARTGGAGTDDESSRGGGDGSDSGDAGGGDHDGSGSGSGGSRDGDGSSGRDSGGGGGDGDGGQEDGGHEDGGDHSGGGDSGHDDTGDRDTGTTGANGRDPEEISYTSIADESSTGDDGLRELLRRIFSWR